jgi:MFS family permease
LAETATEIGAVETQSLWRHSDFIKLWTSETISQFGSQFTGLALPATAIIIFSATVADVSLLAFLGSLPWLLFGLIVGVWVDRHSKPRIMVTSNMLRGILLGLIPVAAIAGIITDLGLPFLYAISFLVGVLQIFFDVSYQSFLPSIVGREQLVEGNSKLEASRSSAQVIGPTLSGIVINVVSAPVAIAFDAISFFLSAIALGRIKTEGKTNQSSSKTTVGADIGEGLAVVFNDKRLRSIAGCTGTSNFFSSAFFAIILPFFSTAIPEGLGYPKTLAPLVVGIIFSVASLGALVGVVSAVPAARLIGLGPAIIGGITIAAVGVIPFYFAKPLTETPIFTLLGFSLSPSVIYMMAGMFIVSIGVVVYNINQVSLRQAIVPIRLQGRMNASMRFLVWGTIPLGALAGGITATVFGIRTAVGISAIGGSLAFLWVLLSPVRSLKKVPEPLT